MRLLLLLTMVMGGAISPALAQRGEPSETEMRAAVERWFGDVHAQYREMAQACVGPVQTRTLPPDICAKICSSPTNCLAPFDIRAFSKGVCRPPEAGGQVYCTFTVDVVTANPAVKEAGAASQGLFDASGGAWRFERAPPR